MIGYILFFSNNYAIWGSKQFKLENIEHKIVPVPRDLSSDCGYCIQISPLLVDKAKEILTEMDIEFDTITVV